VERALDEEKLTNRDDLPLRLERDRCAIISERC
jgi:hypothetical protein